MGIADGSTNNIRFDESGDPLYDEGVPPIYDEGLDMLGNDEEGGENSSKNISRNSESVSKGGNFVGIVGDATESRLTGTHPQSGTVAVTKSGQQDTKVRAHHVLPEKPAFITVKSIWLLSKVVIYQPDMSWIRCLRMGEGLGR